MSAQTRDVIATFVPPVAFFATAIPLWGERAELAFFSAASNVLALGGIALVIQARYFNVSRHQVHGPAGLLLGLNMAFILISVGVGLGFAFSALGNGAGHAPDLAIVAGSMATQIAAFAMNVVTGPPGDD